MNKLKQNRKKLGICEETQEAVLRYVSENRIGVETTT